MLGAPLFTGRKMDALLADRCAEHTTAVGRLLSAHDSQLSLLPSAGQEMSSSYGYGVMKA